MRIVATVFTLTPGSWVRILMAPNVALAVMIGPCLDKVVHDARQPSYSQDIFKIRLAWMEPLVRSTNFFILSPVRHQSLFQAIKIVITLL